MAKANRSSTERRFFVTATQHIGDKILKGDHVLIDSDATPTVGKLVLIGDHQRGRIEKWDGKSAVAGVAMQANRRYEKHQELRNG
jgi:hypothetical protein